MVEPAKMEHAVEHKLLDLVFKGKAVLLGLSRGLFDRNDDVAELSLR
jgi:hypothetical protein